MNSILPDWRVLCPVTNSFLALGLVTIDWLNPDWPDYSWSWSRSYFTTDGQSVCLGVDLTLGLLVRYFFLSEGCCLKVAVLFLWGALSDERTGLQFAVQSLSGPCRAEPITTFYCLIWDSPNLEGQVSLFMSPRNRVAQLYPRALGLTTHSGRVLYNYEVTLLTDLS
jgi:hypothetical protein